MFVMGHQKAPPIVMSLIEFGIDTREIPGYSGYWATCDGRIIGRRGKFRKPQLNRSGYHEVKIWVGESQSRPTVHKLVMLAFEGPRPEGQEVLHRDGNKLNNSKSNLKYGTRSENQFDSAKHGTHHWLNGGHPYANRTHCKQGHEYTPDNIYVRTEKHRNGKVYKARRCRECDLARRLQAKG